jgi:hypothetical protein
MTVAIVHLASLSVHRECSPAAVPADEFGSRRSTLAGRPILMNPMGLQLPTRGPVSSEIKRESVLAQLWLGLWARTSLVYGMHRASQDTCKPVPSWYHGTAAAMERRRRRRLASTSCSEEPKTVTNEEYEALLSEIERLRPHQVESAFGPIPGSVKHLETLLESALQDDRRSLYTLLTCECSRVRNDKLHVQVLRRCALDLPDDPLSHSSLAFGLALMGGDPKEAVEEGFRAVALAKAQNVLVRYCAGDLARVALMVDDYDALHHAISVLVDDAGNRRLEDCAYEFDFLNRIDRTRFDSELLEQFEALAQHYSSRRGNPLKRQ